MMRPEVYALLAALMASTSVVNGMTGNTTGLVFSAISTLCWVLLAVRAARRD